MAKDPKNICLMMDDNNYVGREYVGELQRRSIFPNLILFGKNNRVDAQEDERTGCIWRPIPQSYFSCPCYRFDSLKDPNLIKHLKAFKYDLGIQAGVGILHDFHLNKFSEGILNFHPGDLPFYRGCSAPEYQYLDKNPIVSTCHFVSEGIDAGAIVEKRILDLDMTSYYSFRASVYPETAKFVADIIERWIDGQVLKSCEQNHSKAIYRKYIGDDCIEKLIKYWESERFKIQ